MNKLISFLAGAYAMCASGTEIDPVAEHRWEHRLLLVFAAGGASDQVIALERRLTEFSCGFDERDIVVAWLLEHGDSRVGDAPISPDSVERLRERYRVDPGIFSVLLIGKDGGVKARYLEAPEADRLFALIDRMPMRQSELRARGSACSD